jgi:methylmalonyl-CoA mutase N-terminal domain/subunit
MATVDARGGAVAALEDGFVQREIHHAALAWQKAVERGERVVVGVNEYRVEEPAPEVFRPDAAAKDEVLADLARVRAERDGARVAAALAALGDAARGRGNLLEPMLAAVDAYATVGEVCGVLQGVFGEYRPPEVL